jgi:hypothetical protein
MQRTKRRSAQAWRGLVARFGQSGLTEEAFCEREGVGLKLFHRWRVKRRYAQRAHVAVCQGAGRARPPKSTTLFAPHFFVRGHSSARLTRQSAHITLETRGIAASSSRGAEHHLGIDTPVANYEGIAAAARSLLILTQKIGQIVAL